MAWAAITTSVFKVSYDLQTKTWHCSSTLRGFNDAAYRNGRQKT